MRASAGVSTPSVTTMQVPGLGGMGTFLNVRLQQTHYSPKALGQSDYGDGANRPFQEQTGLGTITNLIGVS